MNSTDVVSLKSGDYEARVELRGGSLIGLSYRGEDYCPEFSAPERGQRYVGSVIAPWANRIAGGRYRFEGEDYQLPVNEEERRNALHGFSGREEWQLLAATEDRVDLIFHLGAREGYPFPLELTATYLARPSGISLEFSAVNQGSDPAPFGFAFHPYFRVAHGAPSEWVVQTPASEVMLVDSERLLPLRVAEVAGTRLDFRSGATPDAELIDHAFTGWTESGAQGLGARFVTVTGPDGRRLTMAWSGSCEWMQMHVPDVSDAANGSVVLEPQTGPPDSFNSGIGLVSLAPQQVFTAGCQISVAES